MHILAIVMSLHMAASNHAAGVEWCTCAQQPVAAHMPAWRAVEPVPSVVRRQAWTQPRTVDPIPVRHYR